ncbi:translation initiation factor IF-2 [Candidatus Pacearchaeota archaeon]|nr:translation initiation factor IF-2 [Candidatus Pacearchaeota archaeon]
MEHIKSPIITVAGHVDHGKTSILDSIRKTSVQEGEAGGITQKISFTKVPLKYIKEKCPLIDKHKIQLDFPGFLFIDTPGHAAFSHLRKRGGSLADLAIVVIDINEGIMTQTMEVLEILRMNKVPFIVALNKIDNIWGWKKRSEDLKTNIDSQSINAKVQFDEKVITLMGSLHHHGFNAKLFYEIKDFSKELALVPCSARTQEGIPELILTMSGLSQKFLKSQLVLGGEAKGVILEIKRERSMEYCEAILYDGVITNKDEIAIASFDDPIITKIRVLEEIEPISYKFKPAEKITAAAGIRLQLIDAKNVLPGMPFVIYKNNTQEIKKIFEKEVGQKIKTSDKGIVVKADSLGSLEALLTLLRQENISVINAGIGKINKKDVISAKANLENDPVNAIIIGFNVDKDEDVKAMETNVSIVTHEVIYKLIDEVVKLHKEKQNKILKDRLMELATISKLKILPHFIFRNSNPAVFGVHIEAGKLKKGIPIINENGEQVARVKDIQEDKKSVNEANEGKDIAISLPGVNFERQLQTISYLYSDLSEAQFKKFKDNKDLLSNSELATLQKIAEIKRKTKVNWGY